MNRNSRLKIIAAAASIAALAFATSALAKEYYWGRGCKCWREVQDLPPPPIAVGSGSGVGQACMKLGGRLSVRGTQTVCTTSRTTTTTPSTTTTIPKAKVPGSN